MVPPKSAAMKVGTVLITLTVILSVVTIGGVAQTDSDNTNASTGDAEPNDSIANATSIEYGQNVNATLSSGDDVDYYAVNATVGNGLISRLSLQSMFEGSAVTVDIVTSNGDVNTETTNDQLGGPKNVAGESRPPASKDTAYTADVMESGGTYYVRVRESQFAQVTENATYRYNLTVATEDLDKYDPNEDGVNASRLELGTEADAILTGYDNDVYAVNVTAGQNYTVTVNSPNQQLPKQVNVFDNASAASDADDSDNNGAVAGEEQFLQNASVTFTAEENGTYYVELTEAPVNNDLLQESNYTLTVAESGVAPDEDLSELPDDGDADSDGLTNEREMGLGTDPRDTDTDDDGLTDDCELANEMDPLNPDTDDDGTSDGQEI